MPTTKKTASTKFKELLKQAECPSAILLIASDRTRPLRATSALINRFCSNNDPKIYHGHQMTTNEISSIEEELQSLSLFSSSSFFIIKDVEKLNAACTKRLEAALPSIPDTSHLIITARKLPTTNPIRKHFGNKKNVIKFEDLQNKELESWIKKELARKGLTKCSSKVIQSLIALSEGLIDEVVGLIEHLSLYLNTEQVEIRDVERLFISRPNPVEFKLLDAIVEKRSIEAESLVVNLLNSGKSPFLILSLLSRSFTQYSRIKALQNKGIQNNQVAYQLNMQPWLFKKNDSIAKRYSDTQLNGALGAILTADSKLKNRSLGHEEILAELIYKLAP